MVVSENTVDCPRCGSAVVPGMGCEFCKLQVVPIVKVCNTCRKNVFACTCVADLNTALADAHETLSDIIGWLDPGPSPHKAKSLEALDEAEQWMMEHGRLVAEWIRQESEQQATQ